MGVDAAKSRQPLAGYLAVRYSWYDDLPVVPRYDVRNLPLSVYEYSYLPSQFVRELGYVE